MQATRTYLQLNHPGELRPAFGDFPDVRIGPVERPAPELYRRLYRTVGEAYHWRDRWDWTDEEIRAHLEQPEITLYVARRGEAIAGWYELRRVPDDSSVEIAYFGLLPEYHGRGLGKHLLTLAVEHAWALGAGRVWLHTCTLDDAAALPNYLARGFRPFKEERYTIEAAAVESRLLGEFHAVQHVSSFAFWPPR